MLAVELIGILYFSVASIPTDLQSAYNSAQKEMPSLDAEISIIKAAKKEHRYPAEGVKALLRGRPESVRFSRVSVMESGRNGAWMEADLVSKEPLAFQDYTVALASDKTFSGASIVRIGSDTSGYKTATVVLRRREDAADGK